MTICSIEGSVKRKEVVIINGTIFVDPGFPIVVAKSTMNSYHTHGIDGIIPPRINFIENLLLDMDIRLN